MPCPLTQTWDAAIAVRDAVYRVLGVKVFIIPLLLFTGIPQDRLIEEWATQRRVKVLFGADDLVDRVLALADRMEIKHPATADHIRNEVAAVTNGFVVPARDGGGHEAAQEFMARQAVIQHVDTVSIHVTAGQTETRRCHLLRRPTPCLRRPVEDGHRDRRRQFMRRSPGVTPPRYSARTVCGSRGSERYTPNGSSGADCPSL